MVQKFEGSVDEFKTLIASGKVVFVDFFAEWCGPCKMIGPYFEELAEANKDDESKVFIKVDVDSSEEIAVFCDIAQMPTFKVYKDGKQVDELIGANKEALKGIVGKTR